jgi:hypothetical protein
MVKRIASFGAVGFVLLVACGAVCQNAGESLPDAPSAVVAAQTERFGASVEEGGSPVNVGSASVGSTSVAARPMRQDAVLVFDRSASRHKDLDAVFRKYLYSSSVKQQPNSKSGGSVMGRATHAAARTVVTRNQSGKGRLNTSYLLRTLSAVAKDSASTPYWRRHLTNTVSDFGSTVGSDAGMNLWHEFGPGIGRLLRNHTSGFVSRIEERIGRG